MRLVPSRFPAASEVPYIALAAPWFLQGVLLTCAVHGCPPFLGGDSSEGVYSAGGVISGTALYLIRILLLGVTIFGVIGFKRSMLEMTRERIILLAFPLYAMASILWSTAPNITLGVSFELLLLTVVGIYIGSELSPEQQMRLFMITGFLAATSSLLLAGVDPKEGMDHLEHVGAIKGIFTQKNACGLYMNFLATPAFFLLRTARANKLFVHAYLVLCGAVVFLSQSRTAWMYFLFIAVMATVTALLRAFRTRDAVLIATAALIVAIAIGYVGATNFASLTEALGKDPSLSGRTVIWQSVFAAITKRPILGYGYAAFFSSLSAGAGDLKMSTGFLVNHPHNGYLSVWLDLGAVGLVMVFVAVWNAFRDLKRAWRANPYTDWYACLLILTLVQSFSETSLGGVNDLSWLLFLVSCSGLYRAQRARKPTYLISRERFVPAFEVC